MKKILILSFILIIIDQVTKFLLQEKEYYFTSFFAFKYTENTGIAFSLFQGWNLLFIIISIIILILVIYYFRKYPIALSFIIAGIVGNLIDRIFFGFVRDFISISIWPVFNVADMCNTIGVVLLIYYLARKGL